MVRCDWLNSVHSTSYLIQIFGKYITMCRSGNENAREKDIVICDALAAAILINPSLVVKAKSLLVIPLFTERRSPPGTNTSTSVYHVMCGNSQFVDYILCR